MTYFSTLLDVESRRRETNHAKPNLYHNQWTLQELVPQQEQHILDNRLPTVTNRPVRRHIRKWKHQVRPLPPEPRPQCERANVLFSRVHHGPEQYWSFQSPRGRS